MSINWLTNLRKLTHFFSCGDRLHRMSETNWSQNNAPTNGAYGRTKMKKVNMQRLRRSLVEADRLYGEAYGESLLNQDEWDFVFKAATEEWEKETADELAASSLRSAYARIGREVLR